MISWIVASHDPQILHDNLLSTLDLGGDQLTVVMDAPSIAKAYNEGQAQAVHDIRCYVHHDVQILDLPALRQQLQLWTRGVGIVGVVGSIYPKAPWWEGIRTGAVHDGRMGHLRFGPGGPAAYLDGLLLATRQELAWDETYPGWHLYDHDICQQQLAAGRLNWCIGGGDALVLHNTGGTHKMRELTGWDEGFARFTEKWGQEGTP
jgi:hypothetical protein